MRNFLDMDSPLMLFLGRIADLMILNIVFVISCIPILTIGPALTALHYVTLKMSDNRESHIIRSYFRSFRQNFLQALVIWLIMLLFAWVLWFDISNVWGSAGTVNMLVQFFSIVALIGYIMEFLYVFPVLARFSNTVTGTFRSAFGLALSAFARTFSMFMLIFACAALTFYTVDTFKYCSFLWLTLGFSSIAYANSFLLKKTFARYIPQTDEPDDSALQDDPNLQS